MVVLPGGFSFGDYLRSGAIARFSPIMQEVVAHAKKGGLVFGVDPSGTDAVLARLADTAHTAAHIGSVSPGTGRLLLR